MSRNSQDASIASLETTWEVLNALVALGLARRTEDNRYAP
jgi:hypothetical protein